jgi:hypothetical protein
LNKVYHRLLFVMSVGDILFSFMYVLSSWPVPQDDPYAPWLSAGTTATCTAQGFISQLFGASTFYNAYLAVYYVLVVRYNWPERKIAKLEMVAHAFAVLFGLSTSVSALFMDLYNSVGLWCWIESIPIGCEDPELCERGRPAKAYQYYFWYVWIWASFGIVVIAMFMLWWAVRKQFQTTNKYGEATIARPADSSMSTGTGTQVRRRLKKNKTTSMVRTQAFLYLAAYFFTNLTNIINQIFIKVDKSINVYPIFLVIVIFLPLQGKRYDVKNEHG